MSKADDLLSEWIAESPDTFLECRLSHSYHRAHLWKTNAYYAQRVTCIRCGHEWSEIRSRAHNGVLSKWDVSYPTDYVKPREATPGRVARALFAEERTLRSDAPEIDPTDESLDEATRKAIERAQVKEPSKSRRKRGKKA